MTRLAGTISTFEGDPDEMFLVTSDSVIAAAQETDPDIADFLRAAVGSACPGFYVSAADIILDAQAAADEIVSGGNYIPPCVWLRRYAPFLLAADFQQTGTEVDFNSGTWLLSARYLHLNRVRVFPIEENNCWEAIEVNRSFYWNGPRPQIVSSQASPPYCDYPQGASAFSTPGGGRFGNVQGERDFKNGTATIVLVEPDSTRVTRDNLTGTPFMPIPPIPDGYPAPPNAPPPLQGQAIVDALSDDECRTIVERGDGFQTLWDIGDRGLEAEPGEIQWYQTNTDTYGMKNVWLLPNVLDDTPVEIMEPAAKIVLGKVLDRVVDAGSVIVKRGGLNKVLTVLGPAGKIIQTVEIGIELFEELQMLLGQLYVPQCINSDPPNSVGLLRMMPIPFPVQTLDGQSTLNGMQAICDALYSLLRCCPPCVTDIWHEDVTMDSATDRLFDFLPSALKFEVVEAKSPSHIAMGGQLKLGYFKWILQDDEHLTDSDLQEPIWVNSDKAFFLAMNGMVKGLRWVPQNGVTVKILYKFTDPDMGLNRLTAPQNP